MPLGTIMQEVIPVLIALTGILQEGLTLSAYGFVGHSVTYRLSHHVSFIEKPDPTLYTRQFDRFFEMSFASIGEAVAERAESPAGRQLSFYLTVSITVLIAAILVYLIAAGTITGAVIVAYLSVGIIIDPTPVFYQVVAAVLFLALAVLFHADARAKRIA